MALSVNTYRDVRAEMQRQDAKFGANRTHPSTNLSARGWSNALFHGVVSEEQAKMVMEILEESSDHEVCWADILTEEIAEAYAASTESHRRTELVQAAAVIFQWIADLDKQAEKDNEILEQMLG